MHPLLPGIRGFSFLAAKNPNFSLNPEYLFPCLLVRTKTTPLEPVYFVQDTWFANRLAQGPARPPRGCGFGRQNDGLGCFVRAGDHG